MRRLEETRANYKAAIGQGHINPTILESRTETEAQPASLAAEARRRVGTWSISRLISAPCTGPMWMTLPRRCRQVRWSGGLRMTGTG